MTDKLQATALLGSTRLNLAFIGFLGCVIVYALRSNVSFAIVCMVNSTAVEMSDSNNVNSSGKIVTCQAHSADTEDQSDMAMGELVWSKPVQGYVLSAFFMGYICSQILGGYLADRFGGRLVIGISVFVNAFLTLVSPIAATTSPYAFIAARALLGFMQGSIFPAFHTMWSMWAPPLERSLLTGITYAGGQIGNTLVMPLSGLLCKYGFAGGWPSIFYVLGFLALMWSVLWFFYVSDNPSRSTRISKRELKYIEDSLADTMLLDAKKKKRAVPWSSILTSVPVWAIFCGHFAGDWGAYIMMTSLPLYMKNVLGLEFTSLGFLSSIPYIAYFVFINLGGFVADKLRNGNVLSTIATRRLAMIVGKFYFEKLRRIVKKTIYTFFFGLGSQALFLIASGYCGCGQDTLVITFLTLGIGLSGIQYAGFVVNYLDIAPTFAGPILGIGNTITCISGIIGPMMVSVLTPTGSQQEWQLVFWITGVVLVTGTIIFCIFAKGEIQPWALGDVADEEECELKHKQRNNSESF